MKKVLILLAVIMSACKTPEPEKKAEQAVINADDVTVEVGKSVRINAQTNSSAPIGFASADAAIASVSAAGDVTGVKEGQTSIMLSVEAVENMYTAAQKSINVTVKAEPEPPVPEDDGKPNPGVYTFTVSELKGQWQSGDEIYVLGAYGPYAQTITLTDAQISADGKTASVELAGDLFKSFSDPDPLYAAWPASAVKKEDGLLGQILEFEQYDILFAQAYLDGTEFKFKDIPSRLSFKADGGYDSFIIAGKQRPGLRYNSSTYLNEYSSAKVTPSKPKDDGYPFLEESLEAGEATLYFAGGINFKGGFTLYFAKGDDWCASYTCTEDANLKAGTALDLGDITSQLVPYSGGKPHMPEMVKSTKYTVKFNELSGLCVNSDGESLWVLGDGGEIAHLSIDCSLLNSAGLRTTTGSSLDSEGITLNYDTGDLILGCEANVVCRIPADDIGNIFASGTYRGVESLFKIEDARTFGNAGLEGITYYKDGLVYCGTQTGSYLYCCNLETGEVLWRKGLREMYSVITEIAGLCYDPLTDWLWVVDSESHKFFALTGDAEQLLGAYSLKTKSNEESICVDHKNGCVWIGDDYGSTSYVYKYEMSGLDDFIIAE